MPVRRVMSTRLIRASVAAIQKAMSAVRWTAIPTGGERKHFRGVLGVDDQASHQGESTTAIAGQRK